MKKIPCKAGHIVQSEQVMGVSPPLVETVATLVASGKAKGVFCCDESPEPLLMTITALDLFLMSKQ